MKFSDNDLSALSESVKRSMSDHRYKHTLGVEKTVAYLGSILLPNQVSELRAAALLHDITKELDIDEQLRIIYAAGGALTAEDLSATPAIHSFSAPYFIREKFPEYSTDEILSAVAKHTLGSPDMSLFDKIIFISDFIEPGRTYRNCISTAKFVNDNISESNSKDDNYNSLNKAVIMAIDFTVDSIVKKNQMVHSQTILTKEFILNNKI